MANIHMLHISKLEEFKEWLVKDGWEIEEPKGIYEVLRARKPGRNNPLIVYTKADAKEHLSLMDKDSGVVGAFLRDSKKTKTNADRIRSMSDEELADMFHNNGSYVENGEPKLEIWVKEKKIIIDDSYGFVLDWLKSEAE